MIRPELIAKIDKLAAKIADEGVQDAVSYHDRVEALKVLAGYYAAVSKGKPPADASDGTLGAFGRTLGIEQDLGNGLRDDRRRRGRPAEDA
jgi:hypothetical protein